MNAASVRGTRDFYPEELRFRSWLFSQFRAAAHQFAYQEYDAPLLESAELYKRKAGEEITEQIYHFVDKGGREVALRPEMTPTLARLVLQKGSALPVPIRWFSIPQCWRYERMTKGRRREHYQWNVDLFGIGSIAAEAEILAILTTFFTRVGLSHEQVGIKISDRRILAHALQQIGVAEESMGPIAILIDKKDKVSPEVLSQELTALGLSESAQAQLLETLGVDSLEGLRAVLGPDHPVSQEFEELYSLADHYGYRDWLTLDCTIVRGLAYYTGFVFEAFDRGGQMRAICGGGRYDRLLSTFGGADQPACGFGLGDVVIADVLTERGLRPDLESPVEDVVATLDETLRPQAIQIAGTLRGKGRAVDLVLEKKKAKWIFKHADRVGAKRVVLIAPEEMARGEVRIKELRTGEESDVPVEGL